MPNQKTIVPFEGTKEQEARLRAVIEKFRPVPGAVMPILQGAQDIYGYLPEEVQQIVAEELGLPLTEVYGTASFYSQFSMNPKGKNQVSVCMGTACYIKGADKVLEHVCNKLHCKTGSITLDGEFSVEATRCVGACGLAPVVTVNDEVYGRLEPKQIDSILEKYMDNH